MSAKEHLYNTLKLMGVTINEMNELQTFLSLEKINNQFYRRLFLKSVFSIIETYIHILKEIVKIKIVTTSNSLINIDWQDLVILNEQKITLDNQGKIKTSSEFQKFEPSFRFTINIYEKSFNTKLLDFNDDNFNKLKLLSIRRNDITHPKSFEKLTITDQEFKDIIRVFAWFMQFNKKMNENDQFIKWIKKINEN